MIEGNVFVARAEYAISVKSTKLRKLLMIGSCAGTPFEKKATFDYEWANIPGVGDVVTTVYFFPPFASVPTQTIQLNENTYIPLISWYRMTRPVSEFQEFAAEHLEKERIRNVIKRFEEAAKLHGCRQLQAASGLVDENAAYETGKVLRDLRKELYEELGV
jgi:hypothetical protein